ncbi:MAG TPA: response regulator transcription factor [Bdellovibrio sp.]|nr:response regulator transcription factor [Bdellovibrio sp.]
MKQHILSKSVGKKHLVLIEDYKLIRIGLRKVLDSDPELEVVGEGENAEQGLQLIQKLRPELVILDLGLPDMDGFQLTREIRKNNPYIKILVLTSHDTEQEVMQALAAGANAYCLKDIMSDRLVEVVKSVCEGSVWLDTRVASRALRVFSECAANRHETFNRLTLTPKEREVLRLLVEGMSNIQIMRALEISMQATKNHICSILQKLSAQDRMEATLKAIQQSLV